MEHSGAGRFSIKTLGCKLNQYEADQVSSALSARGWHAVPFGDEADLVIVHTCTVTDNSDRKCRNYIRQGARFSSGGKVVVTGCLGRRDPKGIASMDEVLAVVDTAGDDLALRIEEAAGTVQGLSAVSAGHGMRAHTRAYVKIQDGCDGQCSYCIVPAVRGKPVSRPFGDVIAHAQQLIAAGVPELVFTGITIGKYDDAGRDLSDLAEAVLSLDGDFRLRITSIEPRHVSEKFISLFAHPKLCDHIHLPLQSGSNAVLARMNRPYTREEYLSVVSAFRAAFPDIAIGADVIVGYPGETDEDFADTLDVVRRSGFSYVHQFTYSPRGGTPSSSLKECPAGAVSARLHELKALSAEYAASYAARFNGRIVPSVVEKGSGGIFPALTSNYLKVELGAEAAESVGRILPVKISCSGGVCRGTIVRI